jgi:tetratricopeptide (TPR) repeat protein
MSNVLLCPNGHQWELSVDSESAPTSGPTACPMCGQVCVPSRTEDHTFRDPTAPLALDASALPDTKPGLPTVPGYEVVSVLGQGGMGTVYKARHLRLNRLVALKMIASEHASCKQLERFQTEGQALAKLDHPHIVQIYEVGESNGVPYFSLELLEGGGLDRKLAGMPQPPNEAARLMETLARAMHWAHQQGIIHRDLKPANILLSRDGQPKISDFGLAKRLEDDSSQTRTGDLLGTPAYMAPEQAIGDLKAIGPAADVYALGVILYEMLTGRPPFRGVNTLETLQLIRFSEPVPPSRLQPGVPRDLETICLKCMEKAPAKRYGSAAELGEDLLRFQTHQPVRARRAGLVERVGKWGRRHPALAALIGVIVLAVIALGALGAWSNTRLRFLAQRADHRSRIARSVVDDLYTQFAEEWLAEEPYKDPIRQEFLEKALRLYQEFAAEGGDDPDVRGETARAHFRLGQIHRILNQHAKAESAYHQAIALQEELRAQFPDQRPYQQDLANSHNWLGELHRQTGALAAAEPHFHRAIELQAELQQQAPRDPTYRKELARSHYNLAIVLMDTNRPQAAANNLASAFPLLASLHDEFPSNGDYRDEWARCFINRGVLHKENRAAAEADHDYRRAIELLRPLISNDPLKKGDKLGPVRVVYRIDLAVAHRNLGNLLWSQDKPTAARAEMTTALDILQRLAGEFPNRPAYQKKLADTFNSLASVDASTKNFDDAEKNYLRAQEHFDRLVNEHPDVIEYQQLLGITLGNLAWLRSERRDWQGARTHYEQAIARLEAARKANPKNPACLAALRNQYQSLAETLIQLGDHAAASEAAKAMVDVHGNRGQDCYFAACFLSRCIPLVQKERKSKAQYYATEALRMLKQARDAGGVQCLPNEQEIFQPLRQLSGIEQILAELNRKSKS